MESRVDLAKGLSRKAKRDVEICDRPKGFFNQCAWTCVGNPSGEKNCRVELPQVSCVRTRCNANGKWADEKKLPLNEAKGMCPATGATVKPCDY